MTSDPRFILDTGVFGITVMLAMDFRLIYYALHNTFQV